MTPVPMTAALSLVVQLEPPSQYEPGTSTSCLAPVCRMAAIAAFADCSQFVADCWFGSFIRPNMTLPASLNCDES